LRLDFLSLVIPDLCFISGQTDALHMLLNINNMTPTLIRGHAYDARQRTINLSALYLNFVSDSDIAV